MLFKTTFLNSQRLTSMYFLEGICSILSRHEFFSKELGTSLHIMLLLQQFHFRTFLHRQVVTKRLLTFMRVKKLINPLLSAVHTPCERRRQGYPLFKFLGLQCLSSNSPSNPAGIKACMHNLDMCRTPHSRVWVNAQMKRNEEIRNYGV